MKKNEKPFAMVIGRMLSDIFKVFRIRSGEQTEEKLTIEQFGFLLAVKNEVHDVIQKDLVEIMGKDKSVILRMIDSMEQKELLRKVDDINDRRKTVIIMTKKGERTLKQHLNIEKQLSTELIEDISLSDLETFFKVVEILSNKAKLLSGKDSCYSQ